MKKVLLIMSLLVVGMVVGVPQATAQDQQQISVTVTIPSVISVTLDPGPSAWAIGSVALGETTDTGTNYFTATNNGNVTEDFSIASANSDNWTIGTTAGSEIFEMKARGGDLTDWTSIDASQTLETNLPKTTGNVTFDLQFTAPTDTAYLDTPQTIIVTVTASAT